METFFFSVFPSSRAAPSEQKKKKKLVPLSSTPDRLTTSFLLSYPLPPLSSSSSPLLSLSSSSSSSLRLSSRTGSGRRGRGADLAGARSRPRSLRRRSAEGESPALPPFPRSLPASPLPHRGARKAVRIRGENRTPGRAPRPRRCFLQRPAAAGAGGRCRAARTEGGRGSCSQVSGDGDGTKGTGRGRPLRRDTPPGQPPGPAGRKGRGGGGGAASRGAGCCPGAERAVPHPALAPSRLSRTQNLVENLVPVLGFAPEPECWERCSGGDPCKEGLPGLC